MKKKNSLLQGVFFLVVNILRKDSGLLLMAIMCIILTVVSSVLLVYIPSYALHAVEEGSKTTIKNLIVTILLYFFITTISGGIQGGRGMRQLYIGRNLLYRLFLQRLTAPYEYTESDTGQKAYEKARQVCLWGADIRQLLEGFMNLMVCIISFFIYVSMLSRVTPLLIVVVIGLSILNYCFLKETQKANDKRMSVQTDEMKKYFYLINTFQSTKIGKDIRLYKMGKWICSLMDKSLLKLREIHNEFQTRILHSKVLITGISLLRDIISYGYLVYQVCIHQITISEFVLYFGIVNQLAGFVSSFVQNYSTLCMGAKGLSVVDDYFRETKPLKMEKLTDTDITVKSVSDPFIEFRDVCFSYDGEHNVLDHLNLTIKTGEKIAVVGQNGVGKTTLVKLICGLYKPQSGQIFLCGKPAEKMAFSQKTDLMGAVFQDGLILPYSIAENISMMPYDETDLARVEDCLRRVDLYDIVAGTSLGLRTQLTKVLNEKGIELSGGQKQKLLMARMLYRRNALLWVMDEPTAALDALAESEIYSFFNKLCGDKTCIYISHRLASTRFLDRIILLNEGHIAEEGTHDELMQNHSIYEHMFRIQSKYYQEKHVNETI